MPLVEQFRISVFPVSWSSAKSIYNLRNDACGFLGTRQTSLPRYPCSRLAQDVFSGWLDGATHSRIDLAAYTSANILVGEITTSTVYYHKKDLLSILLRPLGFGETRPFLCFLG